MDRRAFALLLLSIVFVIVIVASVFTFSAMGTNFTNILGLNPTATPLPTPTPTPTPVPPTPTPTPTPSPTPNPDTPPVVDAQAVYLMDMDSGRVLDNVNSAARLPMASTTKIMTALVAMQQGNLDQIVTVNQEAYNRVHVDGGSSAELVIGDRLTLRSLLYGALVPSGADAAVAIADAVGGSVNGFVSRMNYMAVRLHLSNTHFTNVDGLTIAASGHYTSAADFTHLARYAMTYPLFAQIVQQQTYSIPPTMYHHAYSWQNTNTLLTVYPGMIGIKTGYTDEAGWCLVFAAVHNGHRLIGAVLHSSGSAQRDQDVAGLLDWAFAFEVRHGF